MFTVCLYKVFCLFSNCILIAGWNHRFRSVFVGLLEERIDCWDDHQLNRKDLDMEIGQEQTHCFVGYCNCCWLVLMDIHCFVVHYSCCFLRKTKNKQNLKVVLIDAYTETFVHCCVQYLFDKHYIHSKRATQNTKCCYYTVK